MSNDDLNLDDPGDYHEPDELEAHDLEEWGQSLQDSLKPAVTKDDDIEEEDDQKAYSRRVNKRIGKLKHESYLDREELARQREENEQLKARLDKLERDQFEKTNTPIEDQLKALEASKIEALSDVDYDRVVNIDKAILNLTLQSKLSEAWPSQQQGTSQQTEQTQQAPQVDNRPSAMKEWEAKNGWVNDPKHAARLEKANAVLTALTEDGFDIDDPETYDALDKKLQRIKPPPTGAPDRGRDVGTARETTFTATDRSRMRDWGLNPDNPRERAEWLKNKVAT